jgi:signal transduction histidine kinase
MSTEGFSPLKLEIWLTKNSFYIIDNWIWIKKDDLKNIWNKFFRSDKNLEWFWVWLFLVKRLCDLYSWNISVESKQNKNTKFIINYKK